LSQGLLTQPSRSSGGLWGRNKDNMLKKVQPIYTVSILTAFVGFAGLFVAHSYFALNKETTMSIGAAIFAPVLAIVVGEYLRQRTERQKE